MLHTAEIDMANSVTPNDVDVFLGNTLECVHQVLEQMLHTAELDMADSVTPNDVNVFLDNVAWAILSTYHTVPKASPGASIFGCVSLSPTFRLWLTGTKLENKGNH
jgi:hypothetical protein